jgi:hypothetical protein
MYKNCLAGLMLFWSSLSTAAVVNVEFKFTPFLGDPAKQDEVESVPGKARVFLNNALLNEQPVSKAKLPVLFEGREIGPSVWLPVASAGPALRKGKNKIRIEFDPDDAKLKYRAQLRWASVTDQTQEESSAEAQRSTNQIDEGVDDKQAQGRLVLEREFVADFAAELPWHRYPPVTALSDADKRAIAALVKARADTFKPNFAGVYQLLKSKPEINVAEVQKAKCLDAVYAAGVRIAAPGADQLDIATTGNAEVSIRRKDGELYRPADPKALEKITDPSVQDCAGMVLFFAFPPRMAVVRTPAGAWEVVY